MPESTRTITYTSCGNEVNKFANVLKKKGVKKGDRVAIYLPMIPELPVAMLACARIGAIHCVVFGGFSADALRDRILNAERNGHDHRPTRLRGGKADPLKTAADAAWTECPDGARPASWSSAPAPTIPWIEGRDIWWHEEMAGSRHHHRLPLRRDGRRRPALHPLHLRLHRQAQGRLHTTGGYLLYAAMTHEFIFDYHPKTSTGAPPTSAGSPATATSCTARWPTAPPASCSKASPATRTPTASGTSSRSTRSTSSTPPPPPSAPSPREGDDWVKKHDLSTLRMLGTVGEPINPEAWIWYHDLIGGGRCPIVDTWWQTETGGILITPLPGAMKIKPGSATLPFFGVEPALVDEDGEEITGPGVRQPLHEAALAGHDAQRVRRSRALQGDLLRPVPRHLLHRRRLPA